MDLARAAALAGDRDAAIGARLDALVFVVETVSLQNVPIPESIVDALDDLALIDGAASNRKAHVVCAALHQLGAHVDLETTRCRVVRRLVAGGASGLSLAGLAFEIGDVSPGATLAVRDYFANINARGAGDPVIDAWLGWLASQSDIAAAQVLRQLAARGVVLDVLFAQTVKPERAARLRGLSHGSLRR